MEGQLCRIELGLVGLMGKRLESADGSARLYIGRRVRSRAAIWKIDGRSAVCTNRVDECHVYWERSARSGKKSGARAGDRLWQRGHPLSTGQSRVRCRVTVLGNRACTSKSR